MSYNGSGTFQINSSGQPVVTGTVISSTAFNALTADLATGLSTAITKDGQTTTTARIVFAQGVSSTLVTDATSATTGSIITAGGISMQKALWVGTTSRHVGATQFDAAITYGGVTLSNAVTGTGNMVLSASPTFTGTVAAAAIAASGVIQGTSPNNTASTVIANFQANNTTQAVAIYFDGIGQNSANPLVFKINGTEKVRLDSSGNLGIGMTPSNILDITQNANSQSLFKMLNNSGGASAAATHQLSNGTKNVYLQISGTGNSGTVYNTANYASLQSDSVLAIASTNTKFYDIAGTLWGQWGTDGSFLVGGTTNVGAGLIYASTGLLVGQTTAGFGGGTVAVASNGWGIASLGSGAGGSGSFLANINNTAAALVGFYYNASTAVGSITTNGSITAYNTSSDYRLKENVQPMTGGLATVAALKPVTYDWISNGSAGEGFIAHELQAVIPDAVHGEKDALDKDGKIDPQGVDFSKIVPHLVAAIQELTTRLAALENK